MRLTVLVTTYNWEAALALVLDSIAAQTRLPDEVIVADDGSGPPTVELLARVAPAFPVPLRHCWQPDDGFRAARCRNRAIAAASGDYLVMIDGDMVLHRQFLADHLRVAERGTFLQGGRLCATARETARLLAGGAPRFGPLMDADFTQRFGSRRQYALRSVALMRWKARSPNGGRVMSCNMSFWRDDLLRCNGFDERMTGYGSEDLEIAERLHHLGLRRRQLKFGALAVHLDHPTRAPADPDDLSNPNNQILLDTRTRRITRCEQGIEAHLRDFDQAPLVDLRAAPQPRTDGAARSRAQPAPR